MDTYLLIKYLKCATTPEEDRVVRKWLADDPDGSHAKQYSDAHFLYEGMVVHSDSGRAAARRAGHVKSRTRKILTAVISAAASVVLAAGVGFWSRNQAQELLSERMETIYVPAGKSMQLTMEDGTSLWLNAGTELEYPAVFSRKSRNVRLLRGEVMFDVARDEKRPFNVETYNSSISVLGTKFNVLVDEKTQDFSAALLRGSIKVSNKISPDEVYILRPNQMVRMEDNHFIVEHIDDPEAVECWTNGLIDIAGVPFDMLMRRFELAYDVDIRIEKDTLPEIRYTRGKVRVSDGIEHALSMLAIVADFTYDYDRHSGEIVIR